MLRVTDLRREVGLDGRAVISGINFAIKRGETLFIRGPSGVGKSLLLRSIAYLDPVQGGELSLDGKSPEEYGVPCWRARVTYVPQSRVHPKGTPSELYYTAQKFAAQRGRPRGDLPALVHALGLEQLVLNQPWSELSGGQAQRVTLAICLALKPDFLLLDEPTSALDQESARAVEAALKESGAGLLWVTHDDSQPARIGGRVLSLPLGTEMAIARNAPLAANGGGQDEEAALSSVTVQP